METVRWVTVVSEFGVDDPPFQMLSPAELLRPGSLLIPGFSAMKTATIWGKFWEMMMRRDAPRYLVLVRRERATCLNFCDSERPAVNDPRFHASGRNPDRWGDQVRPVKTDFAIFKACNQAGRVARPLRFVNTKEWGQ